MNLKIVFFRIKKYLRHCFKAKNAYSLHSPFVYGLYMIVKNPKFPDNSDKISMLNLRKKLQHDSSQISFQSLGAKNGLVETTVSELYKRTAKPEKQALKLASIAEYFKSKNILELGTAFATTTLTIHFCNPDAKIFTIEGVPQIASLARNNLKISNKSNIEIIEGDFNEKLPLVIGKMPSVDFAFIDGHHLSEPTFSYLETVYEHLSERAAVVIDDIYYSQDMNDCWEKLSHDSRFQVALDFFHFGVLIKNEDLQRERWILK